MRSSRSSMLVVLALSLLGCARSRGLATADAGPIAADGPSAADAAIVTVPPGQIAAWTSVDDRRGLTLMVEVWDRAVSDCAPPADIDLDGLVILGIEGWDGMAGTWVVGEHTERGVARAAHGSIGEAPTGTLTLEPFEEHPRFISWDLDGASRGRADLGLCGRFE